MSHLKVFVYGTLKVGGSNANPYDMVRVSSKKAYTLGHLFNVNNHFPAAIFGSEKSRIYGEIHEYSDPEETQTRLNRLEGCREENDPNNLYNHKTIEVFSNGEVESCLAYEFNREVNNLPIIPSGVWEINK